MMRTTIEFADSTIRELLICALEGGSNYWCIVQNEGQDPLIAGQSLVIGDAEDPDDHTKNKHLDRGLIEGGLQLMAEKHPKVFADILADKIDADTGDIFLQYCVLGEVIYG